MSNTIEVKVPDIGDFKNVPVIEVFVKPGDQVGAEDSLVALESDKATMEVPSPAAGTVKELKVKVGDKVSEGSLVLTLESSAAATAAPKKSAAPAAPAPVSAPPAPPAQPSRPVAAGRAQPERKAGIVEVKVPAIGDFENVPVIEVLVKPGDRVGAEDSLVTLESDKATMEVPSPVAGVVEELKVKAGDKVSEGVLLLTLRTEAAPAASPGPEAAPPAAPQPIPETDYQNPPQITLYKTPSPTAGLAGVDDAGYAKAHASPSVRRLARELGVDLARVRGSGPKARILKEDVHAHVKAELARPRGAEGGGLGFSLPPLPHVDFAKFGPVQTQPLSRIKKLSGANLHRNWVTIPHITQHDEADITELEAFRKSQAEEAKKQGIRFTLLSFLMKAAVVALRQHPEFNASLSADGASLVLKEYFHIGVAVDTPNGLVVPVIRSVDRKGLLDLARELSDVSARMRDGKILPADLQGGCFSISSLGGIGGTHFTPIINAPEVAILGVGRAVTRPVWNGREFAPRLMLPLSLSYDHRVIDGAQGARFISYLSSVLSDIRRLVL